MLLIKKFYSFDILKAAVEVAFIYWCCSMFFFAKGNSYRLNASSPGAFPQPHHNHVRRGGLLYASFLSPNFTVNKERMPYGTLSLYYL
jgi:hypothetical protein